MYLCKSQKPLGKKLINICTMIEKYKTLLKEFPFLTVIEYAGNEYLGIMQNIDNHIATMYVYDRIGTNEERQSFLRLGDEWWWETNRKLPINIALLNRWPFSNTSQSFNIKQMEVIAGPEVRLSDSITKRIKRRNISLLKKNL
jgi:tyrosine-protein phosphatase YwqE